MKLDLSPDAIIKVIHPDASNKGKEFTVLPERDEDGNWQFYRKKQGKIGFSYRLGRWYILAALNGELERFPIANVVPTTCQNSVNE
jgi:hypothetical protein